MTATKEQQNQRGNPQDEVTKHEMTFREEWSVCGISMRILVASPESECLTLRTKYDCAAGFFSNCLFSS